jgi:5,10-methylenetetrahydromethanopterin reductase
MNEQVSVPTDLPEGGEPKFGFSVTPGPPQGVAAEARDAERLGYDRIGIWDSPALFREPWVTLAPIAQSTNRLSIGTWVTNPVTRHPLVTASAAATLDDLAPGRVYIGIGAGGTGVWNLGLRSARLERLEEYVIALRSILEGRETTYRGHTGRLQWTRRRIPIILSGHGPQSLRLAGRIADGVIVGLGVTPEVVSGSLELIEAGAREAGRSPEDIEVWFTCFWFVDERPGVAAEQGAWAATAFSVHFARGSVEGRFVPPEFREGIVQLGRAYDLHTHGSVPPKQQREYAELARELGVAEYLQRRFVFCGTPEEVAEQIRAAMRQGARRFDGAIDADLPEHRDRITNWARLVLPHFGKTAPVADAPVPADAGRT